MADVIVIGAANIDIKAKTKEASRLGTSNPGVVSLTVGGVGRNIAHNLAWLGADVALISAVGDDAHGQTILKRSRDIGIDMTRVAAVSAETGTYLAVLNCDGELITALSDMRACDHITPAMIAANMHDITSARFVVADCNLPIETLRAIADLAAEKLVIEPVSVPKSVKMIELLKNRKVFLASPNFDQIDILAGTRDISDAFEFLHRNGLTNAVVHVGSEGAFVSTGGEIEHVAAQSAGTVVDVTGAGDAAVAGLVYGLLQGHTLVEAAAFGQQMAGRVIASNDSTLG